MPTDYAAREAELRASLKPIDLSAVGETPFSRPHLCSAFIERGQWHPDLCCLSCHRGDANGSHIAASELAPGVWVRVCCRLNEAIEETQGIIANITPPRSPSAHQEPRPHSP